MKTTLVWGMSSIGSYAIAGKNNIFFPRMKMPLPDGPAHELPTHRSRHRSGRGSTVIRMHLKIITQRQLRMLPGWMVNPGFFTVLPPSRRFRQMCWLVFSVSVWISLKVLEWKTSSCYTSWDTIKPRPVLRPNNIQRFNFKIWIDKICFLDLFSRDTAGNHKKSVEFYKNLPIKAVFLHLGHDLICASRLRAEDLSAKDSW